MRLRPRSMTLLAALIAGVMTDLVIKVLSLHFTSLRISHFPLHAMLETTATVIAFLTTILLWGRLQQRRQPRPRSCVFLEWKRLPSSR